MITVYSITKNTGRYANDTYSTFYIPVKIAFNLPHHATSRCMHHTGKKEIKKKKKKRDNEKYASRGFKPGHSESVITKRG